MPRLRWLDFFRGIAVIGMIATHVAGALLANEWKQGEVWNNLNISFGFVAPAFLLCSGVALWVAMQRRVSQQGQFGKGGGKLLRRAGTILLLGYWLQIPVLSLRQLIWRHDPNELSRLFDSNILHVIGVAMIGLIICVRLSQSLPFTRGIAAVLAVGIIITTPYVWASNIYQSLWLPFKAYAAPQPIASFSLFPHAAYLLIGFAIAPLLIVHSRQRFILPLFFALFSVSVALLLDVWLGVIPPHNNYWYGSIQHTVFRLAGLFFLIALVQLVVPWVILRNPQSGSKKHSTFIEKIGTRSLAIYVLHLMLIYGSPVNMGMTAWLSGQFHNAWDPIACLLFSVVVTILCYSVVILWEWIGKERPQIVVWGKRLWWIAFWWLFLTIP